MKHKIRDELLEHAYLALSPKAQNSPIPQMGPLMVMVDWQRVNDLASEIGVDAVVEVVAMFLEETDEVMARLAVAAPSTEDYHFLKGSALNLGLDDLATLCQLGEQETKSGLVNATTLATVKAVYPAAKAALLAGVATRFGS
ncbi:MAG: Hpt domain-containing protein [Paracoccaceae bacterium]